MTFGNAPSSLLEDFRLGTEGYTDIALSIFSEDEARGDEDSGFI
jgi:hypothetical protein